MLIKPRGLKQQGQVMVAFALVMAGCMVTLLIATLDLQELSIAYNRADTTALLASQAGASAVCLVASATTCPAGTTIYDVTALGGPIHLDRTAVQNNCNRIVGSPAPRGFVSLTCTVATAPTGSQYVIATVVWNVAFQPRFPGFASKNITIIRNGYPAYGCRAGQYIFNPLSPANCF
jgi:hypothetical protein